MTAYQYLLTIESSSAPTHESVELLRAAIRKCLDQPTVSLEPLDPIEELLDLRIKKAEAALSLQQFPQGWRSTRLGVWIEPPGEPEMLIRLVLLERQFHPTALPVVAQFTVSFATQSEAIADAGCFTRSGALMGFNAYAATRPEA